MIVYIVYIITTKYMKDEKVKYKKSYVLKSLHYSMRVRK